MLINSSAIGTCRALLVPYQRHHVQTYHEWMQDPEIQEATASEPLSIEEEYAMQESWHHDPDKLTFIACLPLEANQAFVVAGVHDGAERMFGDVNLFLTASENDTVLGEIELMIAVKSLQGHGYGRATLLAFLKYVLDHEKGIVEEFEKDKMSSGLDGIGELWVKIGESNVRSIGLFESVGFKKAVEEANYFGEIELKIGSTWRAAVTEMIDRWGLADYCELEYRNIEY